MWELRDHKYGGRAKRYVDGPGGVVRCLDPALKRPLVFSTELHLENWLLYWGNSAVKDIDSRPKTIACLEAGKVLRFSPHLLVRWRDKLRRPETQLVLPRRTDDDQNRLNRNKRIAEANHMTLEIRTREEIRANEVLLDNLHYLRQAATMYADEPWQEFAEAIPLMFLREPVLTRADVFKNLAGQYSSELQIDAVLIRLQWQQCISMQLDEMPINGNTLIHLRNSGPWDPVH